MPSGSHFAQVSRATSSSAPAESASATSPVTTAPTPIHSPRDSGIFNHIAAATAVTANAPAVNASTTNSGSDCRATTGSRNPAPSRANPTR